MTARRLALPSPPPQYDRADQAEVRRQIERAVGDLVSEVSAAPVLPLYTTAQRDALRGVVDGMVILNVTAGAVQARVGGAWVNL